MSDNGNGAPITAEQAALLLETAEGAAAAALAAECPLRLTWPDHLRRRCRHTAPAGGGRVSAWRRKATPPEAHAPTAAQRRLDAAVSVGLAEVFDETAAGAVAAAGGAGGVPAEGGRSPLTPLENETLLALTRIAHREARRWGEPALVILDPPASPVSGTVSALGYVVLESQASVEERAREAARATP